jgi:hypothetical protein
MSNMMSFAEIAGQYVELLSARTVARESNIMTAW